MIAIDADADRRACVLISGGPGTGKSARLRELAWQLRDAGQPVSYDVADLPGEPTPTPGWLVVDDAHLHSAATLTALADAVGAGRLRVLAATQPRDHCAALTGLRTLAMRDAALIMHAPLTTADVIARAAGSGLTAVGAAAVRRRSLGVPVVVDDTLARLRGVESPDQQVAAIVDDVAGQWQHRLLRSLDPLTQSVLILAALRQPVDPTSAAAVLDADVDDVVEALDTARGSGLLSESDVFPGVAVAALRTVAGPARFTELHRASLSMRLRHNTIDSDEAAIAVRLGIDDPQLIDLLVDAVPRAEPATARSLLTAVQQATTAPGGTLRIARAAVDVNALDVAAALTDDLLTRCATGELRDGAQGFDIAATVSVAAEVAWSRGHLAHATTLFRWLAQHTGTSGGVGAVIADVATGAGVPEDGEATSGIVPTGSQMAADLFRRGLAESLTDDYSVAAQQVSQAIALTTRSAASHVPPNVWVATMLALQVGDVAGARYLAAADGTGLLGGFVGVVGDDEPPTAVHEDRPITPRDRLLLAATMLGAARRAGDDAALTRVWAEFADVLLTPCSDLFALLPLGEIVAAATRLGVERQVAAHVDAATRLLAAYGDPPAWTPTWLTSRDEPPETDESPPSVGPLTDREAEVARELLAGFTYREIGERLFISAKTVEHHVSRIRRRLDAGSRSDLLSALRAAGYR